MGELGRDYGAAAPIGLQFRPCRIDRDSGKARARRRARPRVAGQGCPAKKELIVPFNLVFPAPQTYYVVSTHKGIQRPKVRLFHDWILEKARHSKPYGNETL